MIFLLCSCFPNSGPVNSNGDSLRSLAESLGLSEVVKYLDNLSADSAGKRTYIVSCCYGNRSSTMYFCQWYVTVPKKMSLESDRENIKLARYISFST